MNITPNAITTKTSGISGIPGAKTMRASFWGALQTHINSVELGLVAPTEDACRVEPLRKGHNHNLWCWVQPILSSGGHIIGAPVARATEDEAIRMGAGLIQDLLNQESSEHLSTTKPECAIPVLYLLAKALADQDVDASMQLLGQNALKELAPVLAYSTTPAVHPKLGLDARAVFLENIADASITSYLETVNLVDDFAFAREHAPHWRVIKAAVGCSNKVARGVRRQITTRYPRKALKFRLQQLQHQCLAPITLEGSHPIKVYVERCWSLRGSSISCSLPKRPPSIVHDVLSASGMDDRDEQSLGALRCKLLEKMKAFSEWTQLKDRVSKSLKQGPVLWSDTLSKFASAINPHITKYNTLAPEPLMAVTSFVPSDLSPEMYWHGNTCTGYFFLGQGQYYCYSAYWRRDAVLALAQLPQDCTQGMDSRRISAHVSPSLAFQGGPGLLEALDRAGVSELQFTEYLRSYYFTGAFLTINMRLLENEGGSWVLV